MSQTPLASVLITLPGSSPAFADLPLDAEGIAPVHSVSARAIGGVGEPALINGAQAPHVWGLPGNARAGLKLIAARLSAADPDNAGGYRVKAAAGLAERDTAICDVNHGPTPVKPRESEGADGNLQEHGLFEPAPMTRIIEP